MTKESSPTYFKIGRTEKKPQLRAIELDGTDSPTPSIVVYYVFCEDIEQLEQHTHKELDSLRVRQNREWFKCSQQDAMDAIKRVSERQGIDIHYEKILADISNESNQSISNLSDEDDAINKNINNVIESIFYYGKNLKDDLLKYKKYLDERNSELNKRSSSNVAGERALAKAAYDSKILELNENYDLKIQNLLNLNKDELGDMATEKLNKLANDLKDGRVKPILPFEQDVQIKIEKEKTTNSIIDDLLKQIY
jgi:hypothetical protein